MKKSEKNLLKTINQNLAVHKKLFKISKKIGQVIDLFSTGLNNDKTIYICGNGGSASDSEHLSTEFLVRLNSKVNRRPFKMVNLGMNLSYITACSNDYSFENVFSRSLEALANPGDILWVISTSRATWSRLSSPWRPFLAAISGQRSHFLVTEIMKRDFRLLGVIRRRE